MEKKILIGGRLFRYRQHRCPGEFMTLRVSRKGQISVWAPGRVTDDQVEDFLLRQESRLLEALAPGTEGKHKAIRVRKRLPRRSAAEQKTRIRTWLRCGALLLAAALLYGFGFAVLPAVLAGRTPTETAVTAAPVTAPPQCVAYDDAQAHTQTDGGASTVTDACPFGCAGRRRREPNGPKRPDRQ